MYYNTKPEIDPKQKYNKKPRDKRNIDDLFRQFYYYLSEYLRI